MSANQLFTRDNTLVTNGNKIVSGCTGVVPFPPYPCASCQELFIRDPSYSKFTLASCGTCPTDTGADCEGGGWSQWFEYGTPSDISDPTRCYWFIFDVAYCGAAPCGTNGRLLDNNSAHLSTSTRVVYDPATGYMTMWLYCADGTLFWQGTGPALFSGTTLTRAGGCSTLASLIIDCGFNPAAGDANPANNTLRFGGTPDASCLTPANGDYVFTYAGAPYSYNYLLLGTLIMALDFYGTTFRLRIFPPGGSGNPQQHFRMAGLLINPVPSNTVLRPCHPLYKNRTLLWL